MYLRKSEHIVFGHKFDNVGGVIPAECMVLSLLVGEMALRELGFDIVG